MNIGCSYVWKEAGTQGIKSYYMAALILLALLFSQCIPNPTAPESTALRVDVKPAEQHRPRACPPCDCPGPGEPVDTIYTSDTTAHEVVVHPNNKAIAIKRTPEMPGYVPGVFAVASAYQSPYLLDVPEIEDPTRLPGNPNVFVITGDLGNWNNVPFQDERYDTYLFTEFDYEPWGVPYFLRDGSVNRRILLAYYGDDMDLHPKQREQQRKGEAILESFYISHKQGPSVQSVSNVVVHGLSFKGDDFVKDGQTAGERFILQQGSANIVVNACYFYKQRGIAMRGTSNCAIQSCVIQGKTLAYGDINGLAIYATKTHYALNNRIVGNEIINLQDGAALPKDGIDEAEELYVNGTVIADNEVYVTDEIRVIGENGLEMSWSEDGFDFKNGSDDPNNPVIIIRNKIHGHRPTYSPQGAQGSIGNGIVIHKDVDNMILLDNIIFDVSVGISISAGTEPLTTSNVIVVNNLIYKARQQFGEATKVGTGIRPLSEGCVVAYNTILDVARPFYTKNKHSALLRHNRVGRIYSEEVECTAGGNLVCEGNVYDFKGDDLPLYDLTVTMGRFTGTWEYVIQGACMDLASASQAEIKYDGSHEWLKGKWFERHLGSEFLTEQLQVQ